MKTYDRFLHNADFLPSLMSIYVYFLSVVVHLISDVKIIADRVLDSLLPV